MASRITETRYGADEDGEQSPLGLVDQSCLTDSGEYKNADAQSTGYQTCMISEQLGEMELQALIDRILKHDENALAELFKALSHRVHSIALRITKSTQLAEEVTEDTFYQIWRQAPRYDSRRGPVSAWILTIARSRSLDAWRAIPPFEFEENPEMEKRRNTGDSEHGEDILLVSEQNQVLHEALLTLGPLPRQLVGLAFFRGLTHEEIAEHTTLPLGTVKSHLRRAVLRLREHLTLSTYYSASL